MRSLPLAVVALSAMLGGKECEAEAYYRGDCNRNTP